MHVWFNSHDQFNEYLKDKCLLVAHRKINKFLPRKDFDLWDILRFSCFPSPTKTYSPRISFWHNKNNLYHQWSLHVENATRCPPLPTVHILLYVLASWVHDTHLAFIFFSSRMEFILNFILLINKGVIKLGQMVCYIMNNL